jgi:broad specificity phosphatase PhoE
MPADRIHLVRHAEVHNPAGVLYGRLPNFRISDLGVQMAQAAAADLHSSGRKFSGLFVSPLQRARESAKPIQNLFSLTPVVDERLIEPFNIFEGKNIKGGRLLVRPNLWFHLRNPRTPSWGEPFASIADRMTAVMNDAFNSVASGDVILVSHQLPIWMAHSIAAGKPLAHNPARRRCSLSSITSFERRDGKFVEVDYREPAKSLAKVAVDEGAV